MNKDDIEIIAEQLFVSLNHPSGAKHREGFIDKLRNSPSDLNGFLFTIIEQHTVTKAFNGDSNVFIADVPAIIDAVVMLLIKKLDDQIASNAVT